MTELLIDTDELQAFADAVCVKVEADHARMKTRSGTVASIDSTGFNPIASLVLDGDPPNVVTPVVVVSGNTPGIGDRATVIFTPPRGAIIIATTSGGGGE